jgi:hypothetical protein
MKTIQEAKRELEQRIILMPEVVGIGVISWSNETFIEVSARNEAGKETIAKLIPSGNWEGYPVRIKVREQTTLL